MAEDQPAGEPPGAEVAAEEEAVPPADMTFLEVQEEAQFLADDEVIGTDVVNVMDEEVGTIADLVMDQEQKLVGVVLSVGGFLGIGEKWVAIPVDEIDFPAGDQPARLLVAVTEEQLTNAPDFVTRDDGRGGAGSRAGAAAADAATAADPAAHRGQPVTGRQAPDRGQARLRSGRPVPPPRPRASPRRWPGRAGT